MPGRIGKTGGVNAPGAIHRPVEQPNAPRGQFGTTSVHIVHAQGINGTDASVSGRWSRVDQFIGLTDMQQVDQRIAKFEDSRSIVFKKWGLLEWVLSG